MKNNQVLLWELGEIDIGVGSLVTTNERVEQAIKPSILELSSWVQQEQPNIHVDETPWSVKGLKKEVRSQNSEFRINRMG
ncbi:IS66 family transposase, partial [Brasilonema bromeliae SPC951]|nr:IS66 family transposase [Brasilonema bromeliae SPC951]